MTSTGFLWFQWVLGAAVLCGGDDQKSVSRELAEMDRLDQKDQAAWETIGDAEVGRRQATRRARVAEILAEGLLKTPEDFHHASWLLQHGTVTEDFLMAHVLASHAAFERYEQARFMAAAGLDRFVQFNGQLQRFGSQSSDASGTELGDRSKLLPDNIVQIYRGRSTGLTGKPVEARWQSKSEIRSAAKDLRSLSRDAKKVGRQEEPSEKEMAERESILARTREIVDRGQVVQAEDFYRAGEILSLSTSADDLLLAHIMATTAGLLGHRRARELFASTLDQYLGSLDRAPVFAEALPQGTTRPPILTLHPRVRKRLLGK